MPAQAAEVARVELGTRMGQVLLAPGGGAWVTVEHSDLSVEVARVHTDGRFTRTPVEGELGSGVVGPDGQAWFVASDPHRLMRVDDRGALSSTPLPADVEEPLATAPDGRVVATTSRTSRFALIAADAAVTYPPSARRRCPGYEPEPLSLAFTGAGASWMVDGCARLLYNGAQVAQLPEVAYGLAPDAAGGVWLRVPSERAATLAHARPDGTVDYITPRGRSATDHAVAPDGSVWLALGSCTLGRVTADGTLSTMPAPIPATQIAFDRTGEVWLSNRLRVARGLGGACDDVAPTPRVPERLTVRALRRGVPLRFTEPAAVRVGSLTDLGRGGIGEGMDRPRVLAQGGTIRYRLPAARLRQIERAERVRLTLLVDVEDLAGNAEQQAFRIEVRR